MNCLNLKIQMPRPALALLLAGLLAFGLYLPANAQNNPGGEGGGVVTVTDNDVNAIAKRLYCPVCENIPLDACGTAACSDWRYEIRLQLEAGMTETEIINDFVARFGDRAVGTPQNIVLRILALVTPWVLIAGGMAFGLQVLLSKRRSTKNKAATAAVAASAAGGGAAAAPNYRDLLEQDVTG